ncbi:MAG TPA: aromatic amino acid ammonia-lyase, partial [Nannocystaceae bacterium]|nr:aromatic amino acid ammonia-lyase [Nannocystaceae bacterium]
PEYRARLRRGVDTVSRLLARGDALYGVSSGFGDSCDTKVDPSFAAELQRNLVRYHGCGTGPLLDDVEALAVVAVRLASLARGWSGVREELLEALVALLAARVVPCIPARGSVGASGDLTPLSYVAAVLCGEREARIDGEALPAGEALARAGLRPLVLAAKEGLALMNGTSAMTGIGCLAWARARRLARWASAATAMLVDALAANRGHFDPRIDALKPHPGHRTSAAWIRADLEMRGGPEPEGSRLQDRYSVRCAPQVIGALLDAAAFAERTLDIEIESVDDNPIVDPDRGEFVHGGNFYGGHVALAFDGLKTAIANVAGLVDRQLALLCHPGTNNGLPANLVATAGADRAAHHGFKAMQITASALAAEALKATMPASVFSRSTECHNQDVVSMGTHAVRDCVAILELAEETAAIGTLALCQALELRGRAAHHLRAREMLAAVRTRVEPVALDRRQDVDIATIVALYRADALPIGSDDASSTGSPSARA